MPFIIRVFRAFLIFRVVREFFDELTRPVNAVHALSVRIMHECPRLKAWFHRTPWISSAIGHMEYCPSVWFDGQRYHAVVNARAPGSGQSEAVFCRCGSFPHYRVALRVARKQASNLATLKVLHKRIN